MWRGHGSTLHDEQTVRLFINQDGDMDSGAGLCESKFSLGFIEHLLSAKNYSRHFMCFTSFYLHNSPFGDGTQIQAVWPQHLCS